MPVRPRRDLGLDELVLDGGHHGFALGERQPEVLWPLCRLLKCRDLLGNAGGAVIGGDLEQYPDVHGVSPIAGAGWSGRAFHNE